MTEIKKTPFYNCHKLAGGKLVDFAGYSMPIQYHSIQKEHLKVRESVGIFDLSHMGEFFVKGEGALDFMQNMVTNDVSVLEDGDVQYTAICYPSGGIVDDLLVYKLADSYMLVVNAANIDKDFDWLLEHKPENVELINSSDEFGILAIQGPNTAKVMSQLTNYDLDSMKFYSWAEIDLFGEKTLFSRTGYTGEDGFEIYCKPSIAESLWNASLDAGKEFEIEPIGLGARDSLRLEMRYMLYGNDIDKTTSPIEAGLSWICKLHKDDFIGKKAIALMKQTKPQRKIQSLLLEDRGIPRKGYKIFSGDEQVGEVTSGCQSPSLNQGIALGYVKRGFGKVGNTLQIEIRNKKVNAKIIKGAFYKDGSHL